MRLANQLRALLERVWQGAAAIFAEIDSLIALAFLARYPTPRSAAHLGEGERWPPSSPDTATAGAGRQPSAVPLACTGNAEQQAAGEAVGALVAILEAVVRELRSLGTVEQALTATPTVP